MNGHFIDYYRHRAFKDWYLFNDSKINLCNVQQNGKIKGETYIMFFESVKGNNILFGEENLTNNINNN